MHQRVAPALQLAKESEPCLYVVEALATLVYGAQTVNKAGKRLAIWLFEKLAEKLVEISRLGCDFAVRLADRQDTADVAVCFGIVEETLRHGGRVLSDLREVVSNRECLYPLRELVAEGGAGAIAILKRGTCTFEEKAARAADAGAVGAVIFNHGDTPNDTGPINGTVSNPAAIPVVGASTEVGEALLAAGDGLELHLKVDASVEEAHSYNLIAETRGGDRNNVVVVGAHLDSVAEGPGTNDNGSGVATVLEIAKQLNRLGTPRNKVRFAFWGSEESGLIGSTSYVERLSEKERERIALYLNFDMLGSSNYARLIYDGRNELPGSVPAPSGSAAIQKVFEDYFTARGLAAEPTEFSGRSDYRAFMLAGIPSGGLFSGADGTKTAEQAARYGGTAGEQFDPYYHTADDTLAHINWASIDELSDGAAYAVEVFADSTLPVNGVAPLRARTLAEPSFDRCGDRWER